MKKETSNLPENEAMQYGPVLCLVLSDKGKNWDGYMLTEDNLNANVMVKWRTSLFKTGNRYHRLVELYDFNNNYIRIVNMNHICLIKNEP